MAILIRILLFCLLATFVVVAIQRWRGPKLLRTPSVWKALARRHDDLQEALRIRMGIGALLLDGPADRAERIMADVNEVIEALVYLVITRENQGLPHTTDEAAQTALDELKDVYTQLMEKASERNEDALDMIRDRLSSTTDGLRESKNDDV